MYSHPRWASTTCVTTPFMSSVALLTCIAPAEDAPRRRHFCMWHASSQTRPAHDHSFSSTHSGATWLHRTSPNVRNSSRQVPQPVNLVVHILNLPHRRCPSVRLGIILNGNVRSGHFRIRSHVVVVHSVGRSAHVRTGTATDDMGQQDKT